MTFRIATISGDGVGPEIIDSAKAVLNALEKKYPVSFDFCEAPMGGIAIDTVGEPMPESSVKICENANAVLLGAVGGPKWVNAPKNPESALLGIRKRLGLYANLRPVKLFPELSDASPLSKERLSGGLDFVIVRELTGGIYFGEKGFRQGKFGREFFDTEVYSELEIERIARIAFELAETRKQRVVSVDKANVLVSSLNWRRVVHDVAQDYPTVSVTDMLVDNAAMQFVRAPEQFDVVLTSNMFGDILSDLASALVGSIGLLPSASLNGTTGAGLFEPIHGSAPDIAGQNVVNPIGTILSAALMLRNSLNRPDEAAAVENAVSRALADGLRTKDIATHGETPLSTSEMTLAVCNRI